MKDRYIPVHIDEFPDGGIELKFNLQSVMDKVTGNEKIYFSQNVDDIANNGHWVRVEVLQEK